MQYISHCFNAQYKVHDSGMCSERLKDLSLVQERVDQVWVVVETISEAGVDDLEYHEKHLLQDGQICCLCMGQRLAIDSNPGGDGRSWDRGWEGEERKGK